MTRMQLAMLSSMPQLDSTCPCRADLGSHSFWKQLAVAQAHPSDDGSASDGGRPCPSRQRITMHDLLVLLPSPELN